MHRINGLKISLYTKPGIIFLTSYLLIFLNTCTCISGPEIFFSDFWATVRS